jgi:hypothetical protein
MIRPWRRVFSTMGEEFCDRTRMLSWAWRYPRDAANTIMVIVAR